MNNTKILFSSVLIALLVSCGVKGQEKKSGDIDEGATVITEGEFEDRVSKLDTNHPYKTARADVKTTIYRNGELFVETNNYAVFTYDEENSTFKNTEHSSDTLDNDFIMGDRASRFHYMIYEIIYEGSVYENGDHYYNLAVTYYVKNDLLSAKAVFTQVDNFEERVITSSWNQYGLPIERKDVTDDYRGGRKSISQYSYTYNK